jgi:hypothetical protein
MNKMSLLCIQNSEIKTRKQLNLNLKNMSEIEVKVKEIIVDKLGFDEADVVPEASFTNDLGAKLRIYIQTTKVNM